MIDTSKVLDHCLAKVTKTGSRIQGRIPYRTFDGRFDDWTDKDIAWWTNGFWPGLLWLAHGQTKDDRLATWAKESETHLDRALFDFFGLHHDVGFMWHISSVARYKLEHNQDSLRRGMIAASVLASRFNLAGRYIRAWNNWDIPNKEKGVQVKWAIIDCLMNLPLLYWASEESKDPRFSQIAIAHTETVLKNFIHPDGSSRHIVEFDPVTGAYVRCHFGQGFADDSAWSRGCSWLVHGMTLGAKYTGRADFLAAAEHAARFFIENLPEDQVPWSDFKAPAKDQFKDSSAAAIAASGILTLAELVPASRKAYYVDAARRMLASLATNYLAPESDEALLQHGSVMYHVTDPKDKDTSLIYGDYYFVEALIKLQGGQGLF